MNQNSLFRGNYCQLRRSGPEIKGEIGIEGWQLGWQQAGNEADFASGSGVPKPHSPPSAADDTNARPQGDQGATRPFHPPEAQLALEEA